MNMGRNQGFSLLEMMIATAVFTIVMGALYGMAVTLSRTERVQGATFQANQDVRHAMLFLVPMLQQASRQTITITGGGMQGNGFTFRVPEDNDGNGYAINNGGSMEVGGIITVAVNADMQLTMTDGNGAVTVLANNINPGSEFGTGINGAWSVVNDSNGNGRQDLGFGITQIGGQFRIQIGTMVRWDNISAESLTAVANMDAFIAPRNG